MARQYAELPTVNLNDLGRSTRQELESRFRALTAAYSLNSEVTVCRVLGRYKMFVATADLGFSPIGHDSQLHPTSIESLLDISDHEDRLLFLDA